MRNVAAGPNTCDSRTELIRYGVVGIISNASSYLLFLLITHYGLEPKLAMTLLYLLGLIISFVGNRNWTFSHKGGLLKAGSKYLLAHACGYLINLSILLILVDRFGFAYQWVQALAIVIVAVFLFIISKYFVFGDNPENIRTGK